MDAAFGCSLGIPFGAFGTSGIPCRLAATGDYPPSLRSPWRAAHVPAGAIPKDGPSAGVTMATAIASVLSGRRVRPDTAMTGEITLTGLVLPVGGIKEKVLGARRLGFEQVILPRQNEQDLDDLPEDVRSEMNFVLAERIEEVLEAAMIEGA
ncbi:MAG: hypothetical protein DSZ00_03060 [Gammaproteobacteria bacterium]|nr:MAG: hypothetical protein DSZ00_03060 [Gammaproteobacteria bacterium]